MLQMAQKKWFWVWVTASLFFRLLLIYSPKNLKLGSRAEVSTPLTSLHRLAEGSMYHGSPLLLSIFGPLTVKRIDGQPVHVISSLLFVIADFLTAMLLRATGQNLQLAYRQSLKALKVVTSEILSAGDIAALIYLWNPVTIVTCVGYSTSPIENLMIVLTLYGACSRLAPLAAFGWVISMHLSLYPAILIIPVILLVGYGPDAPPRKLSLNGNFSTDGNDPSSLSCYQGNDVTTHKMLPIRPFLWKPVMQFIFWAFIWSVYVLVLCSISLEQYGGLWEMLNRLVIPSTIYVLCSGVLDIIDNLVSSLKILVL